MPARKTPLITNSFYHVLNRGNANLPIFRNARDYQRFMEAFQYYQHSSPPLRFSHIQELLPAIREKMLNDLRRQPKHVEIAAFCLMPNHFHFLMKQKEEDGIYNFIRHFADSYTRYFNIKHKRRGTLFEGRFKAVVVETEAQLLHLSRYIHLNPLSGNIVKQQNQLLTYEYSSLPEYMGKTDIGICQKGDILTHFKSKDDYLQFVLNRADYQKSLEDIKHTALELEDSL